MDGSSYNGELALVPQGNWRWVLFLEVCMPNGTRYVVRRGGSLRLRVGTKMTKLKLQSLNGVANFELLEDLPKGVTLEVIQPKGFLRRCRHTPKIHQPLAAR